MIFVWLDDRINPYTSGQSKIQLGKALIAFRAGNRKLKTSLSKGLRVSPFHQFVNTRLATCYKSDRDRVIIATKVGFRTGEVLTDTGLSSRHIIASVQASLKRLGTDYIDLYQLHPLTPLEETLQALEDLVKRGWV